MKKILVSLFLLIFSLCLVGCVDTPNGPGSEQPVGEYDNNKLYNPRSVLSVHHQLGIAD